MEILMDPLKKFKNSRQNYPEIKDDWEYFCNKRRQLDDESDKERELYVIRNNIGTLIGITNVSMPIYSILRIIIRFYFVYSH